MTIGMNRNGELCSLSPQACKQKGQQTERNFDGVRGPLLNLSAEKTDGWAPKNKTLPSCFITFFIDCETA